MEQAPFVIPGLTRNLCLDGYCKRASRDSPDTSQSFPNFEAWIPGQARNDGTLPLNPPSQQYLPETHCPKSGCGHDQAQ
jgi:hypothetical protein